jgi:UDP-N-acetylmuramate dehydrogenase
MDMTDLPPHDSPPRGLLLSREPMSRHVSWRAGGSARAYFQPADIADLCAFLRALPAAEPVLFLGLGSNLLVRDGGFAGTIVATHHAIMGLSAEDGGYRAWAGVPMPHLARFVAKHAGAGAEWMAGVPGTVGGALAMNAGCYGGETWRHVVTVQTVGRDGMLHERTPADYDIGYRHVAAKGGGEEWFVSALLRFGEGDRDHAMARIRELLSRRVASQPLNQPNAGSIFRNPAGDHAARLIESCGLKGYRVGDAQVSTRHANFIVNLGAAGARDIEAVIDHVQAEVAARTGVELIREVRIVGDPA